MPRIAGTTCGYHCSGKVDVLHLLPYTQRPVEWTPANDYFRKHTLDGCPHCTFELDHNFFQLSIARHEFDGFRHFFVVLFAFPGHQNKGKQNLVHTLPTSDKWMDGQKLREWSFHDFKSSIDVLLEYQCRIYIYNTFKKRLVIILNDHSMVKKIRKLDKIYWLVGDV